ncbi:MAG: hypothetical protein V1672_00840 [Candidatus Diapherotrites archaeon]
MVKREVVLETIKKMYDSGIDPSVIENTLKNIGLSDSEISSYMSEVTSPKPTAPRQVPKIVVAESVPEDDDVERIATRTAEKVRGHIAEKADADELKETTTHATLTEHQNKLDEVHSSVNNLHAKVDSFSVPDGDSMLIEIKYLAQRISTFEKELSDIKAMSAATKSIMEKILDTDREILTNLKK